MLKSFKPIFFVTLLFVIVLSSSGLASQPVSAQEGGDLPPTTTMSYDMSTGEEEIQMMPELVAAAKVTAPNRGTGKVLEAAISIPEEDRNLPPVTVDGGNNAEVNAESVIGTDSRVRVSGTTAYPYRTIAYLAVRFPYASGSCTGWFVGARTLVTAGHCVYNKSYGGWATGITVYPGANGATAPYGYTTAYRVFSVTGWTVSNSYVYDYGAIQVRATLGNTVGWLGRIISTTYPGSYTVSGYPGDKPAATQWRMAGAISPFNSTRLWYLMDTYGGQSGSPVYRLYNTACCYSVGIHNYAVGVGGYSKNSATRITSTVSANITYWTNYAYP